MTTTVVHIRVDEEIKKQAAETLATLGLSVPDAVRMMLARVVAEKTLPFDARIPNAETAAALEACRRGDVVRFNSVEDLMADLNADD
ncbi:MAG: type II toxin-antitoxin system RelB/DinJ family antitoxin [Methylococcales bacterium]|nr:type II toxin-antitoxin system RelB/DinJ family antitoxin [Methylococcales bacterium]